MFFKHYIHVKICLFNNITLTIMALNSMLKGQKENKSTVCTLLKQAEETMEVWARHFITSRNHTLDNNHSQIIYI